MENNGLNSSEDFPVWDDLGSDEDFFAMEEEQSKEGNEDPNDSDDSSNEGSEDPKGGKEDASQGNSQREEEDDFFAMAENQNENDEDSQNEDDSDEGDKKTKNTDPNILVLNTLSEKGLVDFELEDGQELTDDLAAEIIEDSYEEGINERIKDLFEELPPALKQMNQFVLKGGNFNEILSTMVKDNGSSGLSGDMSLEDEAGQEVAMRELLKSEGEDSDYIDSQIKFLKENGMLEKISKKKYSKWKAEDDQIKQKMLEDQEAARLAQKEALRAAKKETKTFLSSNEGIGNIVFSKEDKRVIPSYVNDKNVKLANGAVITEFEKDLFYGLRQNKEAYIQLAVMMRNRNEDGTFNFADIEKSIKTNVSNDTKKNIRRGNGSTPNSGGGSQKSSERALASYFDVD